MKSIISNLKFLFATVVIGTSLVACSSNQDNETVKNPTSFVLDKDRINVVADLSKEYENSIVQALSERIQTRNAGAPSSSFNISERIQTLFAQKCEAYEQNSPTTLRSVTETSIFDVDKLQAQAAKLGELWASVIENASEEMSKEEFIARIQAVSDEFAQSILSDNSLNDTEKQLAYEDVVFRTNIMTTTLQYGEDIEDAAQTKGLFDWVKKNLKKIECTALSVAAAGCWATVSATVVGIAGCVASTASAAACWASI
jgi:hypothetical protein